MNIKFALLIFLGVCVNIALSLATFTLSSPSSDQQQNKNLLQPYARSVTRRINTVNKNNTKSSTTNPIGTKRTKTKLRNVVAKSPTPTPIGTNEPKETPQKPIAKSQTPPNIIQYQKPIFIGDQNYIYVGGKHVYTVPPDATFDISNSKIFVDGQLAYDMRTGEQHIPSYEPPNSTDLKAKLLPEFQKFYIFPGKSIRGEKGKIFIDGELVYEDEEFKNGRVRVYKKGDALYVNDNIVLKKNPQKPKINIPNPRDDRTGITSFTIDINVGGNINYRDNRNANYFYYY